MKKSQFVVIVILLCLLTGIASAAVVTQSMAYSGTLKDANGKLLTGTYSVKFSLYKVASGGTALATDTHNVKCTNGKYSTTITFPQVHFNGQGLWLGIKRGNDPEKTPRDVFRPVPYALGLRSGAVIRSQTGVLFPLSLQNTISGGSALKATTSASGSNAIYALTSAGGTNAVYAEASADNSNGLFISTMGQGSNSIFANLTGQYSSGVNIEASGTNTQGIVVYMASDSGQAMTGHLDGSDSSGIQVISSGDRNGGVGATMKGADSSAIYANTSGLNSCGVYVETSGENNQGIIVNKFGNGGGVMNGQIDGSDSSGIQMFSSGDRNTGVGATMTGADSSAIYANTSGLNSCGVYVETSGENNQGIILHKFGNEGGAMTGHLDGSDSSGLVVFSSGERNTGLGAVMEGAQSGAIYANTTNSDSPGIWVETSGVNSPGIHVYSEQSHGIYADTGVPDGYAIVTSDYISAHGVDVPTKDVAEYMPVKGTVFPGTVLIIGMDGTLEESRTACDTKVAGIVSLSPGISLGVKAGGNPGEALVAVAGRVPCNVDASSGPIYPGDLLVTSDIPGHAMKGTDPKIGTVLGKAMGTLESGTGIIEVLVTLQ